MKEAVYYAYGFKIQAQKCRRRMNLKIPRNSMIVECAFERIVTKAKKDPAEARSVGYLLRLFSSILTIRYRNTHVKYAIVT